MTALLGFIESGALLAFTAGAAAHRQIFIDTLGRKSADDDDDRNRFFAREGWRAGETMR
jgi:hypothetical protein